jgi:hypothetical protein
MSRGIFGGCRWVGERFENEEEKEEATAKYAKYTKGDWEGR